MPSTLFIDTRHRRPGSPIHDAVYDLIAPLPSARAFRLKSLQIANTFQNVTSLNNTLAVTGGVVTVPPAFYTGSDLVTQIESQLQTLWGPYGSGYVTLDVTTNTLSWNTQGNTVDATASGLTQVLGLDPTQPAYTGVFTSQLYLALPQYVSFASPQLRASDIQSIHASSTLARRELQPFLTVPVSSAFGEVSTYQPQYERAQRLGGATLSQIRIRAIDPSSGRSLTELTHYAMVLEFS